MAAILVVLGTTAFMSTDAVAAQPHRSATYFGFRGELRDFNVVRERVQDDAGRPLRGVVRVAGDGRRLTAGRGGSKIYYRFRCGHERSRWSGGTFVLARRGRRGAAVGRSGSFSVVKRRGRLRFRVSGRFVSPEALAVSYRMT